MKTYQVDENGYYGEFGGAYAVSYTHLRAHETVLDLVWRSICARNTSPMCGKLAEEVSGSIGKRQFQERIQPVTSGLCRPPFSSLSSKKAE